MGHSLSKALTTVDRSDRIREEKSKLKSSLMEAERSMREKLECVKAKLYIGALNDECIPIVCAVDKFSNIIFIENVKEIHAGWKKDVADTIKRHLRMPDNGEDNQLTTLVTDVLENLITAENRVKEYEEEQPIHVVYANESLIRFDYHIHFEVLEGDRCALSYYGQVGLIDVERARLPVLAYELNRTTKEEHLDGAAEGLKKFGKLTTKLEVFVNLLKIRSESQGSPTNDGSQPSEREETSSQHVLILQQLMAQLSASSLNVGHPGQSEDTESARAEVKKPS